MGVLTNLKEYAVYKGEPLVCIGTIQECAQHMGVLPETVRYYTTPAYQRKLAKRKRARNYLTVTKLEED
ncbi:hypothetical protein AAIE21_26100 [Paenibacillus sp. 102]|uniref:hypothetical protein n=1 Tax=Paenibacillus sp. 102 TaxID=3120823 RepID=UPI0031B9C20D